MRSEAHEDFHHGEVACAPVDGLATSHWPSSLVGGRFQRFSLAVTTMSLERFSV